MLAVVTGAGSGIGLACVAKFLLRDYYVVALVHNGRGEDRLLDSLAQKNIRANRLFIVHADFYYPTEVDAAIKEIENIMHTSGLKINCLINCAGVYSQIGHMLKDGEEIHAMVNFIAPIIIINAIKKHFIKSGARIFCVIPDFRRSLINFHLKNGFKYAYLKSKLDLATNAIMLKQNGSTFSVFLFVPSRSTTDFYTKHTYGVFSKEGSLKKMFSMPPEYSAEQIVLLASRPEYNGVNVGLYKGLTSQKMPKAFFKTYKDGKKYKETVDRCLNFANCVKNC